MTARTQNVLTFSPDASPPTPATESIITEEPLEILLYYHFLSKPARKPVAITMRTPGHDHELALGFLFAEGLIDGPHDLLKVCPDPDEPNRIEVHLRPDKQVDLPKIQRNFYTTSSCGLCGKASLQALHARNLEPIPDPDAIVSARLLHALPDILRAHQPLFHSTGGSHGTALFDFTGRLLLTREDVGRHNATDKALGALLFSDFLISENSATASQNPDARYLDQLEFKGRPAETSKPSQDEETPDHPAPPPDYPRPQRPRAPQLPHTSTPPNATTDIKNNKIMVWSGRASFELVQKAISGRVPIALAIGAPSSLAIELASEFGLTLLGFYRPHRFHCYTHPHRLSP